MLGDAQNLRCTITQVRYNKDFFSICVCRTFDNIPAEAEQSSFSDKNNGEKQFVALGDGLPADPGKEVILTGQWELNKKYGGIQLRITQCEDYTGRGREEIVAYLCSKALKGIGRKTAEAIYDKFGEQSMDIIATDPKQLLQIHGIKEKRLEKLIASYEENHALHALAQLLSVHKVSFQSVVRIAKTLGPTAAQMVKANPYILTRVRGFGFIKTDEIALSMGIPYNSQYRIEGAMRYALIEAQDNEGHMFLPRGELVHRCCFGNILNKAPANNAAVVSPADVNKVLEAVLLQEKGSLKSLVLQGESDTPENQRIYTFETHQYETLAAEMLCNLLSRASSKPISQKFRSLVAEVQCELGVILDEKQEDAVLMALTEPICIITGGPGTGKTTTLNVLVAARERLGCDRGVALAAPTGRAARRMSEQTGKPAQTLHSLFGIEVQDESGIICVDEDTEPLDADMLIIDETSMVDAHLFAEVLCRVGFGTQIVFVGDADQLPSVGPGSVLKQLLMIQAIRHVKLEKIFRQGADSVIPVNSKRVKTGQRNLLYNQYFKLIHCDSEQEGAQRIKALFSRSKAQEMLSDIQILAPMRRRGATSINSLNELLHDIVNPPAPDKIECSVGNTLFRIGDKVMHIKNTDGASNGDIGYVISITPMENNDRDTFSMKVQFAPEWVVEYSYTDALVYLEPATAITIHKSQGGEFPVVLIPIFKSMSFFLQRNVLYTAITRAKVQVVIIGQEDAVSMAISKIDSNYRNTMLSVLTTMLLSEKSQRPGLL